MSEVVSLRPADLLIDEENPRLAQPNEGQRKALLAAAQHLGPKLHVLAADIVRYGIDPSTLPIVTKAGKTGRFVVLEGNRRLVALRVLENPESVAAGVTPAVIKKLRQLNKEYQLSPVESLNCVVLTRDEARHWIELRHTGENAGAGLVGWSYDQSTRWKARTGKAGLHTQALDFLEGRGDLSIEVRENLPSTTFKRLIGTPEVRSKLGIGWAKGRFEVLGDEKLVARALMHIVNDLASKHTKVSDVYTQKQREKYAADLPAGIAVKRTKGSPASMAAADASTQRRQVARSRKKRDRLIPPDCILTISDARLRDIETELRRRLSLENHTNAVAVLFRVFAELSVDAYAEAEGLGPFDDTMPLRKKMETVVNQLVTRNKLTRQQAAPVRKACQKDSFLAPSVTLMNHFVHNKHVFPAPGDLRAYWDNLQPFFAAMWPA
jgi:hypothetical protein